MPSNTETTQTETSSTTVPATVSTSSDRVLGLVKWFQGGFGFVTNFDTKEDGAKALVKSLNLNDGSYLFNVGINKGSSINEISDMISHAFNWDGNFVYDSSKPDGVMKKTVNGDYGKRLLDWAPTGDVCI